MTPIQAIVLFLAAFFAGALNSVAGGGSFISFPTLIWAGLPTKIANTTKATNGQKRIMMPCLLLP